MKPDLHEDLAPYLARLREIPFVEAVRLATLQPNNRAWDAAIEVLIEGHRKVFLVEVKRTPRLDYAVVNAVVTRLAHANADWILLAPFITTPMAEHLHKLGVNFLDLAGNCRLVVDARHVAFIQGRRPATRDEGTRTLGPAGFQVLFGFLARPELLQATVRAIADRTGVGKTAAAMAQTRLIEAGVLAQAKTQIVLVRPKEALEMWIAGYRETVRPKTLLGTYETQERDPIKLEHRVENLLPFPQTKQGKQTHPAIPWRWAWGGTAAAHRLTGHYRGELTVLHVGRPAVGVAERLRVLPARTGPLTILRAHAPLVFEGAVPRTAHPLLVYTELLITHDDRAREAAVEILEKFLPHLR